MVHASMPAPRLVHSPGGKSHYMAILASSPDHYTNHTDHVTRALSTRVEPAHIQKRLPDRF
jgi:hypothetical protein